MDVSSAQDMGCWHFMAMMVSTKQWKDAIQTAYVVARTVFSEEKATQYRTILINTVNTIQYLQFWKEKYRQQLNQNQSLQKRLEHMGLAPGFIL